MGQSLSNGSRLLEETQFFALWTIADVRELWKRFQKSVFGFALVEAQFESIMAFKDVSQHVELETLFEILDYNHDGRIDGLEFLGGLALCCQASFEEKARFCFEMYDFNLNASMSEKEMTIMIMASINGMILLTGGDQRLIPALNDLDKIVRNAFERADKNKSGQINFDEFMGWARSNRDVMTSVESLSKISYLAKTNFVDEDSAAETEEWELSDAEEGCEHGHGNDFGLEEAPPDPTDSFTQWKAQMKALEPTNYKASKKAIEGPDTNLELCWAFGYSSTGCRNNVHYITDSQITEGQGQLIVWPVAALAVVYDLSKKEQRFYQGHSEQLTCIALHPKCTYVATGDCKGNVHLWSPRTQEVFFIIKCLVKNGVQHLCFSPQGDKIAVTGSDADHTVTLYSVSGAQGTGALLSSGKGIASPNNAFDIAFSPKGDELCVVGRHQVLFFRGIDTGKRALESVSGRIGHIGKRQTFFCVTYLAESDHCCVVGCASGELYKFVSGSVVQIVQAHGPREPVLSLHYSMDEGILLSGGKDGLIKCWDSSLKESGVPLDMSEDLDGDGHADINSTDSSVISVELHRNKILIATKGCDIFEAKMPQSANDNYSLQRIGWGHARGALLGLAAHPSREEFATCGDDMTLRIWSIRSHEQINCRTLIGAAHALSYSPSGELLAVGLADGSVALVEVKSPSLRIRSAWHHAYRPITVTRFSPDGTHLAVASSDRNIYIYKSDDKKNFRRQAVCRGHLDGVLHVDFSANGQVIQSNGSDLALLFWDLCGNPIKNIQSLRDLSWATSTCTLTWATQGVWILDAASSPIRVHSCCCVPEVDDLVMGDNQGRVNLFRYPAVSSDTPYLSYIGHSHPVAKVRVSANKRYVISIGGNDRTILLWRHEVEDVDATDDEGEGYSSDSSMASDLDNLDHTGTGGTYGAQTSLNSPLNDFSELTIKSPVEEAVCANASSAELRALMSSGQVKDSNEQGKWKSSIIEPTIKKTLDTNNDVDLTLRWIHGYKCKDCRNSVRYSASGRIMFTAANVGVVYSKTSGKQTFLLGAHNDEILCIAVHPNGQYVATGDSGSSPTIVIWNSGDTKVLQRITGSHEKGVAFLAFSTRGNLMASIGLDRSHTLVLHDWQFGIEIMRAPTQRASITCIAFLLNPATPSPAAPKDIIITGGHKHLTYWWTQGSNVKSQRGLWGSARQLRKYPISCIASGSPEICVTGNTNGDLIVWYKFKATSDSAYIEKEPECGSSLWDKYGLDGDVKTYPHAGHAILSVWAIPGDLLEIDQSNCDLPTPLNVPDSPLSTSARYITGDHAGNIMIWRLCVGNNPGLEYGSGSYHLRPVQYLKFTTNPIEAAALGLSPTPMSRTIKSLCERDGVLLIGTAGGEIYEAIESSIEFLQPPATKDMKLGADQLPATPSLRTQRLLSSHFKGEVCALASHPFLPVVFTAGDDGTLRCWCMSDNRMLSYLTLPQKCRSIDINLNGEDIAAVLSDGDVWIVQSCCLLKPDPNVSGAIDVRQQGEEVNPGSEYITVLPNSPKHCGQVIKYCAFDCERACGTTFLAVGCHDKSLYIYSIEKESEKKRAYKYWGVVERAHGASIVTHIDFGVMVHNASLGDSARWVEYYDSDSCMIEYQERRLTAPPTSTRLPTVLESAPVEASKRPEARKVTVEDIVLQSASADGGLLFWQLVSPTEGGEQPDSSGKQTTHNGRCRGIKALSSPACRDACWGSWSSPYGWPVQGIWPALPDGSDVTAVARPRSWEHVNMISTGDTYGRLRLFSYPTIKEGSPDKCYRGHSGPISNCVFTHDDSVLVTVGGKDRCMFVWETDIIDEIRERKALKTGEFGRDSVSCNSPSTCTLTLVPLKAQALSSTPTALSQQKSVPMPWKNVVREPIAWRDTVPKDTTTPTPHASSTSTSHTSHTGNSTSLSPSAPSASLELRFVYGYRGWDCRNNIGYAGNKNTVIYHVAGVGISYNTERHTQVHNLTHAPNDIISLALHPSGHTVATGECASRARIVIWDAYTGVTVTVLTFHRVGVSHLAFSSDGALLISAGLDHEHTIAAHNLSTGAVVGIGKSGHVPITTLSVSAENKFLTGGDGHIKFWDIPPSTMSGGMLGVKSGIFSNKAIVCRQAISSAYLGIDGVTGMSDGTMLLWKERSSTKFIQAHCGPVTCLRGMSEAEPRLISGGSDGWIHIWSYKLSKQWSLNLNESTPPSCLPSIASLAIFDTQLLFGTMGSEIYSYDTLSGELYPLVVGHYSERGEVWGLATNGTKFLSAGDDGTVRLWDSKTMRCLGLSQTNSRVRAIAVKPDGSQVVVGTLDGKLIVLTHDLREEIVTVTVCTAGIWSLAISPDSLTLAAGAADGKIYLLDTKQFSVRAVAVGVSDLVGARLSGGNPIHTSPSIITSIDFSCNSAQVQATTSSFELQYWDASTGDSIKSCSAVRDTEWASQSCPYGWAVQGAWSSPSTHSPDTIITTAARAIDKKHIVTGDSNGALRLYTYPANSSNCIYKEYTGHVDEVKKVIFGDRYVITVGGVDKAIMQYEAKGQQMASRIVR